MPVELPIYQVDAFADRLFSGNPAAVVLMESWLADPLMQQIAAENNLSETAFLVSELDGYGLRWFTPTVEVPLCGHATLAAGYVVFRFLRPSATTIRFKTREAGVLTVSRQDDVLALDFPAQPPQLVQPPPGLAAALGSQPAEILANGNLVCVFHDASAVAALRPNFQAVAALPYPGVIATAPGRDGIDFVSRYFAPQAGIDEDPVTGSAHCVLIPYWSARLGRRELEARQISPRGGSLFCVDEGDRVSIAGTAQLYLQGSVFLP